MKVVIFAGGFGSRISEESHLKPKPMIEIGGKPILWHIMKTYQHYGFNEFIVCLGYKGYYIKEYFINYFYHNADLTIDLNDNSIEVHQPKAEDFKITLVDTGLHTMTAGRLKQVEPYIKDEDFLLTYGDGVCDVDIKKLVEFHKSHGKLATVTAVQPGGRFGILDSGENNLVNTFEEKPKHEGSWINGGFFVLRKEVFNYLNHSNINDIMWEQEPMRDLVSDGQMVSFKHEGFWKCMDTLRDKNDLEKLYAQGAPWMVWNNVNV